MAEHPGLQRGRHLAVVLSMLGVLRCVAGWQAPLVIMLLLGIGGARTRTLNQREQKITYVASSTKKNIKKKERKEDKKTYN